MLANQDIIFVHAHTRYIGFMKKRSSFVDPRHTGIEAGYIWGARVFYSAVKTLLRLLVGTKRRYYLERAHIDPSGEWLINLLLGSRSRTMYEPAVRRVISMKLSRGGVFVDLGAAQGFHSLFAARRVGNEGLVLAIEPDPNNVEVLTNLGRRSALENLRILPLAIWTKNGYVKLARGLDPLTGTIDDVAQTKIENGKGGQQGSYWGERIKVRARRLDKTLEEFSHHRHTRHEVDLLKIDVEGAELPILSDPSLDLRAVRNIVLEVHYPRESIEFGLIVRSLQRKGFSVKIMSDFTLALFKTKPPQLLCQRES